LKKVIILDEADSMTEIAQEAMRRIMEIFSYEVRFVFICNFPSKIIEAIQSRCALFRLKKIREDFIINRLIFILNQEKMFFDIQGIEIILFLSNGDIRQTINRSEILAKNLGGISKEIFKNFYSISKSTIIIEFFYSFFNKNQIFTKEIILEIFNEGYDKTEVLQKIFEIAKRLKKNDLIKLKILNFLCRLKLDLIMKYKNYFFSIIFSKNFFY
jgi:replication factor C subunit 2/4